MPAGKPATASTMPSREPWLSTLPRMAMPRALPSSRDVSFTALATPCSSLAAKPDRRETNRRRCDNCASANETDMQRWCAAGLSRKRNWKST